MTAFSPQNLLGMTVLCALMATGGKWAYCEVQDFIQPLPTTHFHPEIDVAQLVAFVQNPVKYFFEKQLGVYFEKAEKGIAEK